MQQEEPGPLSLRGRTGVMVCSAAVPVAVGATVVVLAGGVVWALGPGAGRILDHVGSEETN